MFKLYDLFRKTHQELLSATPNKNTAALLLAAYPKLENKDLSFPINAARAWAQTQDLINWCEQSGILALEFVAVQEYPSLATITYSSAAKLWEHFHQIKIAGANIFESELQLQQGAALDQETFLARTFNLANTEELGLELIYILKMRTVYNLIFTDGFETAELYQRQQQIEIEVERQFGSNLDAYLLILNSQL